MTKRSIRFAAIGLNHNHIYGQTKCLLDAGAELVAFHAVEDDLAASYAKAFPQAKRVGDVGRFSRIRLSCSSSRRSRPMSGAIWPSASCATARM